MTGGHNLATPERARLSNAAELGRSVSIVKIVIFSAFHRIAGGKNDGINQYIAIRSI